MKYQIILHYRTPEASTRESAITRDSDEEAREAAIRWARLVCNAAGPDDPKPLAWLVRRLGVDDMFHLFDTGTIDYGQRF